MSDPATILLTGASAGIGLAALQALQEDAFVIAVSRTPPPLENFNGHWLKGDLRSAEDVAADIAWYLQAHMRPLDGIIHCAVSYGATQRHPLVETLDDEFDELMAVNARSQFILTTRFLPLLLARPRAFIIGITSDAATQPVPERVAYGCSKAASYALLSGLSAELVASNVSVIQMLPKQQVVTRGIRRRRPADFDFSGYSSPEIFKQPIQWIVRTRGEGMNGLRLVIS